MPDFEDEEIVVNTPKPKRKKVNIPVFSGKFTNFSFQEEFKRILIKIPYFVYVR